MKKILISILALGSISSSLHAQCYADLCSNVTITHMSVSAYEITVKTTGRESDLTSCSAKAGDALILDNTTGNKNEFFKMLLEAKKNHTRVSINSHRNRHGECSIYLVRM